MIKHLIQFFAITAIFISTCSIAQPQAAKIEAYIEKARSDWGVPGMAVAIVHEGKIISSRGYGVKEQGKASKVDEQTLFAIASNTKAFVASALGVLHQQGHLSLDDKVHRYIPEFQLYDSYASEEATIRDLLCHRVGLGTYSGDVIWYKSDFSPVEVIEKIRFVPKKYSFRAGYGYSNLMFISAGDVILRASGQSWDDFIRQQFFKPLDMSRTITSIRELGQVGNYAIPHKPIGDENIPIEWVNWDNMGAAGGIISSADDMAKWLMMQLDGGIWRGDTLLDPAVQNILWTPHNNYTIGVEARNSGTNFAGYGLGWGVRDYFGYRLITHGGGYDGMYSQVAMLPELDLGIVILTNTMKGIATPLRLYIINQFIKKDMKDWSKVVLDKQPASSSMERQIEAQKAARIANTKPSFELNQYAGTYLTDMHGPIHIVFDGRRLNLNFEKAPDLTASLEHWHYNTWKINWDKVHAWFDFGTIQFHHDNTMKIVGFEFDVPNNDIFFHELKVRKVE
jgi:CubicO group peptidase (beta-lactamase class C family)